MCIEPVSRELYASELRVLLHRETVGQDLGRGRVRVRARARGRGRGRGRARRRIRVRVREDPRQRVGAE